MPSPKNGEVAVRLVGGRQQQMLRPDLNATAYIFQMKKRFRDDYRYVQHRHGVHRIYPDATTSGRQEAGIKGP